MNWHDRQNCKCDEKNTWAHIAGLAFIGRKISDGRLNVVLTSQFSLKQLPQKKTFTLHFQTINFISVVFSVLSAEEHFIACIKQIH